MIAEALKTIQESAVKAAGATGKAQVVHPLAAEPRSVYGLVKADGSFQRLVSEPPPRAHRLGSLREVPGFVEHCRDGLGTAPAVWYSTDGVTVVIDDRPTSQRDSIASLRFTETDAFDFLANRAKGTILNQKSLLQLVRRTLWDCFPDEQFREGLIRCLRSLTFVNATSGHGEIETGRASYGRDVKGQTESVGGDLRNYERIALSVRLFADPSLTVRRTIRCLIEDDPIEHTFQLVPLAGEIERARDEEAEHISEVLLSDIECPVFHGWPKAARDDE